MTFDELKLDVVILVCAVSAGVHAALAPEHFREGVAPGTGFAISAVLLAALAVALTRNPTRRTLYAAMALLTGLLVAYGLVVATGIPLLHPEREELDGLATVTKAIEAAGLAVGASLVRRPVPLLTLTPKGTLT